MQEIYAHTYTHLGLIHTYIFGYRSIVYSLTHTCIHTYIDTYIRTHLHDRVNEVGVVSSSGEYDGLLVLRNDRPNQIHQRRKLRHNQLINQSINSGIRCCGNKQKGMLPSNTSLYFPATNTTLHLLATTTTTTSTTTTTTTTILLLLLPPLLPPPLLLLLLLLLLLPPPPPLVLLLSLLLPCVFLLVSSI